MKQSFDHLSGGMFHDGCPRNRDAFGLSGAGQQHRVCSALTVKMLLKGQKDG